MNKRRLLNVLSCMAVAMSFSACSSSLPGVEIVPEGEVQDVYEYTGKSIYFPAATVVDRNGDLASYDVTYSIYDENGELLKESEYSSFNLDVGNYELVYSYKTLSISADVKIVDTTAPVITFGTLPSGLYIQNILGKNQYLPSYEVTDLSRIRKQEQVLKFNGEEIEINTRLQSYQVTTFGTLEYTVSATDIYGNSSSETVSWKVKDNEWEPESIEAGAIMDFADSGYGNYVEEGDVNYYYKGFDYSETFLSEYKGASGVLRIDAGYSSEAGSNNNQIRINYPAETRFDYYTNKDRYLVVRMLVENGEVGDVKSYVNIAGNIVEDRNGVSSALTISNRITLGEWQMVYIPMKTAAQLGMFPNSTHDNGIGTTFPGNDKTYYNNISKKVSEALQLSFSESTGKSKATMSLYLDSISIAEDVLEMPSVTISGNTASWNTVNDATSYLININGTESVVTGTSVSLPEEAGYVTVSAVNDHLSHVDSKPCRRIFGTDLSSYASRYDSILYKNLLDDSLNFSSDEFSNRAYLARSISCSCSSSGFTYNLAASNWGIVNGFSTQLARSVDPSETPFVTVEMSVGSDAISPLRIFSDGGTLLDTVSLAGKAKERLSLSLDLSSLDTALNGIQFIFGNGSTTASLSSLDVTMYGIVPQKRLESPVLLIADGTLFWNPVDNADGYVVRTSSGETEISVTSVKIPEDGKITVKAVSESINYLESNEVTPVTANGVLHTARVIDTSEMAGGYTRTGKEDSGDTVSLIQLTGADFGFDKTLSEFTFDSTGVIASRNGVVSSSVLNRINYHPYTSPAIFQPHFNNLIDGDTVSIIADGSYISYGDAYFTITDDLDFTYSAEKGLEYLK